jgi:hypothetical protein
MAGQVPASLRVRGGFRAQGQFVQPPGDLQRFPDHARQVAWVEAADLPVHGQAALVG